jgi:DMSO/TMAO reductase YedYZ heme-binding membrane subunit
MLKLTWQQRLRLWLWQQRRALILLAASLLTVVLTICYNLELMANVPELLTLPLLLLTLGQLGIAGIAVIMLLLLSD